MHIWEYHMPIAFRDGTLYALEPLEFIRVRMDEQQHGMD